MAEALQQLQGVAYEAEARAEHHERQQVDLMGECLKGGGGAHG